MELKIIHSDTAKMSMLFSYLGLIISTVSLAVCTYTLVQLNAKRG